MTSTDSVSCILTVTCSKTALTLLLTCILYFYKPATWRSSKEKREVKKTMDLTRNYLKSRYCSTSIRVIPVLY